MKVKPASQANNIRTLRKAAGMTLQQLADAMVPPADQAGLHKVESGQRNLTLDWMNRIAAALRVEPTALIETGPRAAWVPLIGAVAAGDWREAIANPEGQVPMLDAPRDAFALRADGDSMDRIVPAGGFVVVDPHARDLVAGRVYVAMNGEGEATVKRFAVDPARFEPCSTNPAHRAIALGHEPITVIGRVVWTGGAI